MKRNKIRYLGPGSENESSKAEEADDKDIIINRKKKYKNINVREDK